MIIGLSGYIGSGKDTVAKMMQYWTIAREDLHPEPFRNDSSRNYGPRSGWEIKKFAGKLKQMVSLLTGIPVADLEKEEVKSSFLGPEWNKYRIRSNFKGTREQFDKFCEDPNIQPLRSMPVDLGDGLHYFQYEEVVQSMTVRQLLQQLGTDAMRDVVHPNIHVNALFADYKPVEWKGGRPNPLGIKPNWIISDVRFPNEGQAIKDRGGIVIRVHRPDDESLLDHILKHPSETSLDNWDFDATINNGGTLEDLLNSTKEVLEQFNILT